MMALETLTAKHTGEGTWEFTCPLHPIDAVWHHASSPSNALTILKEHMDADHPGVKARLHTKSDYDVHTTYTAQTIVETGDLL